MWHVTSNQSCKRYTYVEWLRANQLSRIISFFDKPVCTQNDSFWLLWNESKVHLHVHQNIWNVILYLLTSSCFVLWIILFCNCYRITLAVLHFNENANNEYKTSSQGDTVYKVVFPKYRNGDFIVKPRKVAPTYSECYCF